MSFFSWKDNKYYKNIVETWRKAYCFIIPIIVTIIYIFVNLKFEIKICESANLSDILTSLIMFVSIIISFFGVLLTMMISIKETSNLVQYFLKSIHKEDFVNSIKKMIMCGLFTVIMSIILFAVDIVPEKIFNIFTYVTVYSLIRFTALTFRFTNIMLSLFINDKTYYDKKEGKKLSDAGKQQLDKSIESFNE